MSKYFIWLSVCCFTFSVQAQDYTRANPVVSEWLIEVSERNDVPISELEAFIAQGERRQDIIDLISRPAERTLSWADYRAIFLDDNRIKNGAVFWQQNADVLAQVAEDTGVDAKYIVAIIGVETRYGKVMGRHRVIDALTTLSFDYPKRAPFFRGELEHFYLLTQAQGLAVDELFGSYAGAMGMGQFMPSSYRAYAVDHTQDGVADIWSNASDAIASVANYFKRHGWTEGGEVIIPLVAPENASATRSLKLDSTVAAISAAGYTTDQLLDPLMAAKVFEFEGESAGDYWMALPNFYTITRYNHSHFYAMAVHLLANQIEAQFSSQQ